ncbi:MAG: C2H2-type zinc finger protein [Candidatus Bathyarchaeia archaeon]
MGQTSLDYQSRQPGGLWPLIGLYSCVFCDRRFSTKAQLKKHYQRQHGESIPSYDGNIADNL